MWGPQAPPSPPAPSLGEQRGRFASAIRRYKWLILAIVAVGSSAGYLLTRLIEPKYVVQGSIVIRKQTAGSGPITSPGLISDPSSWADIPKSFIVLDEVVQKLGLFVWSVEPADSALVSDLKPSGLLRPGPYEIRIDESGTRYDLVRPAGHAGEQETIVETGIVGDSIGRVVGFLCRPEKGRFAPASKTAFYVVTPRDASVRLSQELNVSPVSLTSNLMRMNMVGDRPVLLAAKMNAILHQFVKVAAQISRENLTTIRTTVEEQMQRAAERLTAAEGSLESFKVRTITLPSEATVVAPGTAMA